LDEFLKRLKERKLVQWTLAYVAAAFALIQVLDVIGHQFGWPDAVGRAFTVAAAGGFFIALVLAWYHGERGAQRVSGPELLMMALLLAIAGGLLWRLAPPAPAAATGGPASPSGVPEVAPKTLTITRPARDTAQAERGSIAVLPFANLSADKETGYFVEGIRDMILTRLATIGDLKVISRTSTDQYGSQPADLKTIALQLGVASVLEGSAQKAGNQVLINVQLIDANSDGHLWAEAYKRTMDDIFGVEGEVAQTVAEALHARLSTAEQREIRDKPTTDAQALDLFLRAEHVFNEAGTVLAKIPEAIVLYEQAVARDPQFALAWARLANARAYQYFHPQGDWAPTQRAADLALLSAERALALKPQLPEANLAMGYCQYWVRFDLKRALASFEAVLRSRPNDANALVAMGLITRRLGRINEAVKYFESANMIDPRNESVLGDLTITEVFAGRYSVAATLNERMLSLDPGNVDATTSIAWQRIFLHDDVAGAVALLVGSSPRIVLQRAEFLEWQKHYHEAIALVESVPDTPENFVGVPKAGRLGMLYLEAGQEAAAHPLLLEARRIIRSRSEQVPDDHPQAAALRLYTACFDAALGDHEAALEATRRALALPVAQAQNNYLGWIGANEMAMHVYALAHRADLVLQLIEQHFQQSSGYVVSRAWLRLGPELEPIRSDPGFQALLKAHPGSGDVSD
jgi:TolB-like protein/Flp pilus assembly protein TadD